MDEHQKSFLVDSEICQACANCCKTLRIWVPDSGDILERLRMLDTDLITAKREQLRDGSSTVVFVDLNIPCKHLGEKNGKYFCKIWDSPEKPALCRNYPTNQFVSFENRSFIQDSEMVKGIIEMNKDLCPIFETLTRREVEQEQGRIARLWAEEESGLKK